MKTIVLADQQIVQVLAPSEHPDYKVHQNGVVYVFQDGSNMWSLESMSAEELLEHKKWVDMQASMPDIDYDQEDYEPRAY